MILYKKLLISGVQVDQEKFVVNIQMNFGSSLFIQKYYKDLTKLLEQDKVDDSMNKIREISKAHCILDFVKDSGNYKKDSLQQILRFFLPMLTNDNIHLRLSAKKIIEHWFSMICSFSPDQILTTYSSISSDLWNSDGCAILFNHVSIAMLSLSPSEQKERVSFFYELLMKSNIKYLRHVSDEIWIILSENCTCSDIMSILELMITSTLYGATVLLCKNTPNPCLNYVLEKSDLKFVSNCLDFCPKYLKIDYDLLLPRLFQTFTSGNNSDISASICIIKKLTQRVGTNNKSFWEPVIQETRRLWDNSTLVCSIRSQIIEMFSLFDIVSVESMSNLLIYDRNIEQSLLISIIELTSKFINLSKTPKGFFELLDTLLVFTERESLVYLAVLKCVTESMNKLLERHPSKVERIIYQLIYPLPMYFVEQIAIIEMIKSIDYEKAPFKFNPTPIILSFLEKPHPKVILAIREFINLNKHKLEINYMKLNWFEYPDELLGVIDIIDPFFVVELIDFHYIAVSAYPDAIDLIIRNLDVNDPRCKSLVTRVINILVQATKALGYGTEFMFSSIISHEWDYLAESFVLMIENIDCLVIESTFGKVVDSSLRCLILVIDTIETSFGEISALLDILAKLGCAFTLNASGLMKKLVNSFLNSTKVSDTKSVKKVKDIVLKFLKQPHQVSLTSSFCQLPPEVLDDEAKVILRRFIEADAYNNSISARELYNLLGNEMVLTRAFLSIEDLEFCKKCSQIIPFEEWILDDDSVTYIRENNIHGFINDFNLLTPLHRDIYELNKDRFIVKCMPSENCAMAPDVIRDLDIKLNNVSQNVEFLDSEEIKSRQKEQPDCLSISFSPRVHPIQSLKTLITLLLNPDTTISKDTFERIEQEVYKEGLCNSELTFSILQYSLRSNVSIDINKWARTINLFNPSKTDIFNYYLLLQKLVMPLSSYPDVLAITKSFLTYLGADMNNICSVFNLLNSTYDCTFKAIELLIASDKELFKDIPIYMFVRCSEEYFKQNFDMFLEIFRSEPMFRPYLILIMIRHIFYSPIYPLHIKNLYPKDLLEILSGPSVSQYEVQYQYVNENLPKQLIVLLSELIENNDILAYQIAMILSKFEHEEEELNTFKSNLKKISGPWRSHYIFDDQSPEQDLYSSMLEYFPPSYSIQFLNYYFSPSYTISMKSQVEKIFKKLPPVFIDCIPNRAYFARKQIADENLNILDESVILSRPPNKDVLKAANRLLLASQIWGTYSLEIVSKISDAELAGIYQKSIPSIKRLEISREYLYTIRNTYTSVRLTIQSIYNLTQFLPKEDLWTIVSNSAFLNHKNILIIYAIVMTIYDMFDEKEKESMLDPLISVLQNPMMKKVFGSKPSVEVVSELLMNQNVYFEYDESEFCIHIHEESVVSSTTSFASTNELEVAFGSLTLESDQIIIPEQDPDESSTPKSTINNE